MQRAWSWQLGDVPDAVPAARRHVAAALRAGEVPAELVSDVELVVTELASNAILHGEPPLSIRIEPTEVGLRVEVQDASPVAPLRTLSGPESMTGRGLSLVAAVATRWGVRPVDGGKVVWAEVGRVRADDVETGRAQDVDDTLRRWPDLIARPDEPMLTVGLGDVPTGLLLAAKAHVDNVLREFTLAAAGSDSGSTAKVSPELGRLILTVSTRFAEARRSIKAQALEAAAAGEARTRLVLTLPVSAAEAGRDYLAALDEVDAYARAARLLTLESPPEHRAFRRWYVTALVDQLTAAGRGERAPAPPSFETFLLDELRAIASWSRVTERAARLQSVTASLAGTTSVEEVADVVVSEGVRALGASGGGLLLPAGEEHVSVPSAIGYEQDLIDRLRAERRDARLPAAVAISTGEAVWLSSREEREREFPELTGFEPTTVSMCAVPLRVQDRVLGALRFSFDSPRLFDEDERAFVEALAAQTALAVDRSQLHDAELEVRHRAETAANRLSRLHRVAGTLAEASTYEEVGAAVVAAAGQALEAVLSALSVLEGDTLRIVGLSGARPGAREQWATFPLDAPLPASEAVRTNCPVVVHGRAEMEARYPRLRGHVAGEGVSVSVPVTAGGQPLGALTLRFPVGHDVDQAEMELLATIARQCGVALERARLFAAERAGRERSTFLADAVSRLGSSLDPVETLRNLTDIVVPRLGDWTAVYLMDDAGHVDLAAAAHRDPELTPVIFRLQHQQPLDLSAPDGVPYVLRTGQSLHYEVIPEDLQQRALERIPDADVAEQFRPTSAVAVALTAHGRVLGALALARTEGAAYTEQELGLIEDLGSRAAVAVENAESYRRERDAALTLQRSLLPQRLPHVDGVSFAWRYLPGAAGTHIGGDWYDVIPLDQGRVGLVIGDVMGRGLQAAALMGQLRATARAHAATDIGPEEVLRRLDASLARLEQDQITTALFALLDPGTRSLTLATAGHLPPLVSAGGEAEYLSLRPGPPLGAGGSHFPERHVTLLPGSMLLLYTDGLVEDRRMSVEYGMETLRTAVATADSPEEMCDVALAALGRDTQHDDDTAILAVALR